jgi:hypothetical protein
MITSSTSALPKGLDVEKLLCELTLEEKVSLTAGKCLEFSKIVRKDADQNKADVFAQERTSGIQFQL